MATLPSHAKTTKPSTIHRNDFPGKYIYLTLPLTKDEDFPKVWDEYLSIRRRQLDELCFRN